MKPIIIVLSIILLSMNSNAQNNDFIEIVRLASKAPSGHNTQPWKFRLTDRTIAILPNWNDTLPVVDVSHRELYISLGCATENLCIAASHFGYDYQITNQSEQGIFIHLLKSDKVRENPLFSQIEKRQTNRSIYNNRKITGDTLKIITSIALEQNIQLYMAEIRSPFADTLTQYIAKGNEIQMNDKAFKKELLSWMRFNKKQIDKTKSGLTYKNFGSPSLPTFIAKPLVSIFLKSSTQNKSDLKKINTSSHLAVFTTQNNTPQEWINLGRTLQRFLLQSTEMGIANAYMNQPCEINLLATQLQASLPINNEFLTLIVRIGYAKPMPYSPRKNVYNIIE